MFDRSANHLSLYRSFSDIVTLSHIATKGSVVLRGQPFQLSALVVFACEQAGDGLLTASGFRGRS